MRIRTLNRKLAQCAQLMDLPPGTVFRLERGTKAIMKVSSWTQFSGTPTPLRDRNAVYLGTGQAVYISGKTPVVPLDATLVVQPERDLFSDILE